MTATAYPEFVEMQSLETEPLSKSYLLEDTRYLPDSDVHHEKPPSTRFSGWRGGLLAAIGICSLVLLLNILLAVLAAIVWKPEDGISTAFTGSCRTAARWTTSLHLLINLFSSALLGASNYSMQRLVAPTRKEIDHAHAKKRWLDIGMPSIRNVAYINRWRALLWILLALSSVPLHFIYNSAVFQTIAAHDVAILTVAPEFFVDKESWGRWDGKSENREDNTLIDEFQALVLDGKYNDPTLFENLTATDCIDRYNPIFITNAGVGFAVPNFESRKRRGINGTNSLDFIRKGIGELKFYDLEDDLSYCLSQVIEQKCQVQFSLAILWTVIACNAIKLVVMSLVFWMLNYETIVTIGDAIKSFLQTPDPSTEDCCLMSRRNMKTLWKVPGARSNSRWLPRNREPWFGACSWRRWAFSLILYIASLACAGALFQSASYDGFRAGFGEVNTNSMVDVKLPFSDSIIPHVLLANLPQAIISFLYLTYNGIFTCMLVGREWARYSIKQAPLRVTAPQPGQRSTYFLQLPYLWSIPLLVASALLHWFVSQSIFLARIAIYEKGAPLLGMDPNGDYPPELIGLAFAVRNFQRSGNVFSGVGYSETALMAAIIWGSALVGACLLVAAICTYPNSMPVGATNSAVISAACHVRYKKGEPEEIRVEEDIAVQPLMWGVTIPGARNKIGHCSFSPRDVEQVKSGHLYAGVTRRKKD